MCFRKIALSQTHSSRASPRVIDFIRGAKSLSGGGQNLKLSTKAAFFKRESLLIGGANHIDWGQAPLAPHSAGPAQLLTKSNIARAYTFLFMQTISIRLITMPVLLLLKLKGA